MHTFILIPVYNNAAVTFDCLRSLEAMEGPPFSVIIGDNGSETSESRLLHEFLASHRFRFEVTLQRNDANRGFGAINNQMVKSITESDCRLLFLNNDTVVGKNCLRELIDTFETMPGCGGVCPLICFHGDPDRIWYGGGRVSLRKRSVFTHRHIDRPRASFPSGPIRTDFLTGCALLTTRRIFETVGGFDEQIFLYCEDVDWSLRAVHAGFQLSVTGATVILHKVSSSSQAIGRAHANYLLTSSILYCSLKNFSLPGKLWALLKNARKIAGFALKVYARSDYPVMKSFIRGTVNGLRLYWRWCRGRRNALIPGTRCRGPR